MGFFDLFKGKPNISYENVENPSLKAISKKIRVSNEDTVFISTSRLCPSCSMYNRRVFSLYGKYKPFPILPTFLHNAICPTCGTHIGFSQYFPGINGNLKKDIQFSNKPYTDQRTSEEKRLWNEKINKNQFKKKNY